MEGCEDGKQRSELPVFDFDCRFTEISGGSNVVSIMEGAIHGRLAVTFKALRAGLVLSKKA